ncbi:MAG: ferrochelatase [Candidatus Puniceispirillaceae bacterium]
MSVKDMPSDHPVWPRHAKTGLLLVNLGTPDGTDTPSMRRYLKQFLSDRRVVEVPRLLWWLILNGIILNIRPRKSGDAYERIWLKEGPDGSPLRKYTRLQAEHIAKRFGADKDQRDDLMVSWAMRYGNPSIPSQLERLRQAGCNRFVIIPLYPQYAASTTATVNDEVFEWALKQRWQPAIRTAPPWHDHPAYISALAQSVKDSLGDKDPEKLMVSFHGIPQRYFVQGDPYHCHCMKTARLLREELDWPKERYQVTFQSRFGREPWLQPYTDETLEAFGAEGTKSLAIMAPGFVADCLETLEELAMEGKEQFQETGGGDYHYIPCLNDSAVGLNVIETIVRENLAGWVDI